MAFAIAAAALLAMLGTSLAGGENAKASLELMAGQFLGPDAETKFSHVEIILALDLIFPTAIVSGLVLTLFGLSKGEPTLLGWLGAVLAVLGGLLDVAENATAFTYITTGAFGSLSPSELADALRITMVKYMAFVFGFVLLTLVMPVETATERLFAIASRFGFPVITAFAVSGAGGEAGGLVFFGFMLIGFGLLVKITWERQSG